MEPSCIVSVNSLPTGSSITFNKSWYFVHNGPEAKFPPISEILAQSAVQSPDLQDGETRPPVYFEEMGLVVKYGKDPKVSIAEGQCLWALQKVPSIGVPEIYGWTQDENYNYVFLELVHGVTLENSWDSLTRPGRVLICEQLRSMLTELRSLQQEPEDVFVGGINRGPLADIVFTNGVQPRAGPFSSVREFHDWISSSLTWACRRHWPGFDPADIPDPYRQGLPDDVPIVFSHADLHPSNILLSSERPYRVVAIVDWQQSGWYPEYWDYCKAEHTVDYKSEWAREYIPQFLEETECMDAFQLYTNAFGV